MSEITKVVISKIKTLRDTIGELHSDNNDRLSDKITVIENMFLMETNKMMMSDVIITQNDLLDAISSKYIFDDLDEIYMILCSKVESEKGRTKTAISNLRSILERYPRDVSFSSDDYSKYDVCKICDKYMCLDPIKSYYYCNDCSYIRQLIGTTFDEPIIFGNPLISKSISKFSKVGHLHKWWQKILAQEPDECLGSKEFGNYNGERMLAEINDAIRKSGKILRLLTVNDTRSILKELGYSKFYDNVPLIMKKITGMGPPEIPEEIGYKVNDYFTMILSVSTIIRSADKKNQHYYPYYIMKILDAILPMDSQLRKIFYYIYIQSKDTIEKNDLEW